MDKPKVFVAYPYSFSKKDYRRALRRVGGRYGVEFTYADQKITNKQILVKIFGLLEEAAFGVFDVTTWNANVALELGIAMGADLDYYILFNPKHGDWHEVPSDLGGIDRIQYTDFSELEDGMGALLRQQFGTPTSGSATNAQGRDAELASQLDAVSTEIPTLLSQQPGRPIGDIASSVGVPVDIARSLVKKLVAEKKIRAEGIKRGTRYYPAQSNEAPAQPRPARPRFSTGESVTVVSGPLSGFSGKVSAIDPEMEKLKVVVSIFGRETPVDVGFDQVERT